MGTPATALGDCRDHLSASRGSAGRALLRGPVLRPLRPRQESCVRVRERRAREKESLSGCLQKECRIIENAAGGARSCPAFCWKPRLCWMPQLQTARAGGRQQWGGLASRNAISGAFARCAQSKGVYKIGGLQSSEQGRACGLDQAILLSLPYAILVQVFAWELLPATGSKKRAKPTQVIYVPWIRTLYIPLICEATKRDSVGQRGL